MEIIPVSRASATSADIVLNAGMTATIHLKDLVTEDGVELPGNSRAHIQLRSGTQYLNVAELTERVPAAVIYSPGTYRVFKPATNHPLGVDQN